MYNSLDAIVLGLGAMGSAAIYQLRKRGATVLGLDRFKPPHEFGSTHGDTRITRIACGEGPEYSAFAERSHEIWREIEAETGQNLLTQNGLLVVSGKGNRAAGHENPKFFETTVDAADLANVNYEILTGSDARRRFPAFNLGAEDRAYHDDVGGFVRPELCIESQLQLAQKHGAILHYHETVVAFEQRGEFVFVQTNLGSYRAKTLIMTAGPWLPSLLPPIYRSQLTVTRQVLYWFKIRDDYDRPHHFAPENFPVFIWQLPAPQIIYGFPAIDGADKGVKIATEQYALSTTPETVDRDVSLDETREMYDTYIAPYFPGLSNVAVKTKVCLYTCVPNARFIIDRYGKSDAIIVASPCSGHGFKHSAAIGELLAKMALGERHQSIARFAFPQ